MRDSGVWMRGNRLVLVAFASLFLIAANWDISMYDVLFYLELGAAPGAPAAGKVSVYGRNFELCSKGSNGVETCMSAGGGGGASSFGVIGNAIADIANDTLTVTDSASVDFTTTDGPEDLTATVLPAGITLAGDVDGAANANDLDEANVEIELEGVLDLLDLQDGAAAGGCTGSQVVRRNSGDTAFECATLASGSSNVVEATVDFGATGAYDSTTPLLVAAAWVTGTSKIICAPTMFSTADRPDGSDDALLDQLTVAPYDRSAGVGFSIKAHAPRRAFGKFIVQCTGV